MKTPRLSKRVQRNKKQIRNDFLRGYKESEIGRVHEIDTRTIKRALALWNLQDAAELLNK